MRFKIFWKGKLIKAPTGFELMTYRSVVNIQTHCTSKKKNYKKNYTQFFLFILIGCTSQ